MTDPGTAPPDGAEPPSETDAAAADADAVSVGADAAPADAGTVSVGAGTYELLQQRLQASAAELTRRADALNDQRVEVFGSSTLELLGGTRVRTDNNAVPRDVVQVGELLLFGYNVFIGLRETTSAADVFALHQLTVDGSDVELTQVPVDDPANFLSNERFVADFEDVYRYYKAARLLDLVNTGARVLAVFQTGATLDDVRVFRWRITAEGRAEYLDNRGERDYRFPPRFDFEWTATTRADHHGGRHPAIGVVDEVFVDPAGGSLVFRAEDNTPDGRVLLAEPVQEVEQSLSDCDVEYAVLGSLILLRVTPYREQAQRCYVYDRRHRSLARLDAVGVACQTLPEDHGVIFPGGYFLQDGEHRAFDVVTDDMTFESVNRSPNGEDALYVFAHREHGSYVLLSYNQVRREVRTPIVCHGVCLFDDGHLVVFRDTDGEATRVHPMQVWATPFVSDEVHARHPAGTGRLARIGNAELVRGVSDALSISRLARSRVEGVRAFEDLIASCSRAIDAHHWLDDESVGELGEPIREIRDVGGMVLDEFEQVRALRETAAGTVDDAARALDELRIRAEGRLEHSDDHTGLLAELRAHRGHLVTLRSMRYVDLERLDDLGTRTAAVFDAVAERTVVHLAQATSFEPFHRRLSGIEADAAALEATVDADAVGADLDDLTSQLDVVSDVVSGLDVADPTVRTSILERIADVVGGANRVRALLTQRVASLAEREGRAEFAAEFALIGQSLAGALAQCTTPERTDEQLGRMLVALENLEARFGEVADFAAQIHDKRDDIYDAFAARKQTLVDDRLRTAERLDQAADRVLQTVTRRASSFGDPADVAAFFAADPMVERLRTIVEELVDLGEVVRADELMLRLSSASEQAQRGLRDRLDIFEDGGDVVRFGSNRFSVNGQTLEASLVPTASGMELLLTGTDYRELVTDEALVAEQEYWPQRVVSETADLSRAEYLAVTAILAAEDRGELDAYLTARAAGNTIDLVRTEIESRFDEGYERGVHDLDAARIIDAALPLYMAAGPLRFTTGERTAAQLYWAHGTDELARRRLHASARAATAVAETLGHRDAVDSLIDGTAGALTDFVSEWEFDVRPRTVAAYLVEEIALDAPSFVTPTSVVDAAHEFRQDLSASGSEAVFEAVHHELVDDARGWFEVVAEWVEGWLLSRGDDVDAAAEIAATIVADIDRRPEDIAVTVKVEGLLAQHKRHRDGVMSCRLDDLLARVEHHRRHVEPGFRRYQRLRHEFVESERDRLRLDEFVPRVMSGFVRNRLIDEVYLPLIGDNLAKQLGTVGGERVDQSGLLLLISPPGYGKTTLMEYVADRLGLVFVKVNGPALGHAVTSLDPAEAPDATSRREVERINFAFEMGNNVVLYLDDIQHTNPELLQKFISLGDGQRRVEGVWNGRTRTYDLRGKRFAVVMAGNPYTESGEAFRIPDMLANRADTWNLGDVLSGREEQFRLSYLQNCLTSNEVTAPLAGRDPDDLLRFVDLARGEPVQADELSHPYSAVEIEQITRVVQHLLRIQDVVLSVNLAYIASAATADEYRTEPPFRLQGSYRNMNRLAEKVLPAMTEADIEALLDDHYIGEAQTLASGAEENTLKLKMLRGQLSPEERNRWDEIVAAFRSAGGSAEGDPLAAALTKLDATMQEVLDLTILVGQASEQVKLRSDRAELTDALGELSALLRRDDEG